MQSLRTSLATRSGVDSKIPMTLACEHPPTRKRSCRQRAVAVLCGCSGVRLKWRACGRVTQTMLSTKCAMQGHASVFSEAFLTLIFVPHTIPSSLNGRMKSGNPLLDQLYSITTANQPKKERSSSHTNLLRNAHARGEPCHNSSADVTQNRVTVASSQKQASRRDVSETVGIQTLVQKSDITHRFPRRSDPPVYVQQTTRSAKFRTTSPVVGQNARAHIGTHRVGEPRATGMPALVRTSRSEFASEN
jgi:hypothetical protein